MTQETEGILRTILDELNRARRRQAWAFILLLFTTMGLMLWLGRVSTSPVIDVGRTIAVAAIFGVPNDLRCDGDRNVRRRNDHEGATRN